SSIAVPGFNGFVGEFLILLGSWPFSRALTAVAALGVVLAAAYILWMVQRVLYGEVTVEKNRTLPDLSARELVVVVPLVALALFMGVASPLFTPRGRRAPSAPLALLGLGAALAAVVIIATGKSRVSVLAGTVAADDFALLFHGLILAIAVLAVLLSPSYLRAMGIDHGEYYALLLFSVVGMLGLVSCLELLSVFVALEIMSVAVYAMAGLRRDRAESRAASAKHFITGAFSSAFFLYGVALLYGTSGSTWLARIAPAVSGAAGGGRPRGPDRGGGQPGGAGPIQPEAHAGLLVHRPRGLPAQRDGGRAARGGRGRPLLPRGLRRGEPGRVRGPGRAGQPRGPRAALARRPGGAGGAPARPGRGPDPLPRLPDRRARVRGLRGEVLPLQRGGVRGLRGAGHGRRPHERGVRVLLPAGGGGDVHAGARGRGRLGARQRFA